MDRTQLTEALAEAGHLSNPLSQAARLLLDFPTDEMEQIPMMRVSALANEWIVCDPADADIFVIDVEAVRRVMFGEDE